MLHEHEPWYVSALAAVTRLHGNQTDAAGEPVLNHVVRVAHNVVSLYPAATRAEVEAALIHHAFDHDNTAGVLYEAGIEPSAICTARELVRLPGDYRAWIAWLCCNVSTDALRVKLADTLDECDPARIERAGARWALHSRYMPAKVVLESELARRAALEQRASAMTAGARYVA